MTVLEEESAGNLGEVLVDSDKGGQATAPITGPTSTTSLEGLFQAGLFGRAALLLCPLGLSAAEETSAGGGGEGEERAAATAFDGEQLEEGFCSSIDVDIGEEDRGGGDWWFADIDSESPRTTLAQGVVRLLTPASQENSGLGEWWLAEESAAVAMPI